MAISLADSSKLILSHTPESDDLASPSNFSMSLLLLDNRGLGKLLSNVGSARILRASWTLKADLERQQRDTTGERYTVISHI
jgi:hypothetical protein